jgi:hypothetical protein
MWEFENLKIKKLVSGFKVLGLGYGKSIHLLGNNCPKLL